MINGREYMCTEPMMCAQGGSAVFLVHWGFVMAIRHLESVHLTHHGQEWVWVRRYQLFNFFLDHFLYLEAIKAHIILHYVKTVSTALYQSILLIISCHAISKSLWCYAWCLRCTRSSL